MNIRKYIHQLIFEELPNKEAPSEPEKKKPEIPKNAIKDKMGRTLVKNRKTGNIYFVKNVNTDRHIVVDKSKVSQKDIEKATKKSGLVKKPETEKGKEDVKTRVQKWLAKRNQTLTYRKIYGKTHTIGVDPNGRKTVYDYDGRGYDYQEFLDISKSRRALEHRLNSINKFDLYLDSLDKIDDTKIAELKQGKEVTYELLTDNKNIRGKLTRSYPTVDANGTKIIVGGRFKGYKLYDMINAVGRQLAGTAYVFDEKGMPRLVKYKKGNHIDFVQHEPYITKTEAGNYMVILPKHDKIGRQNLTNLAKVFKTVRQTGASSWMFTINDFDEVNETLGGLAVSEDASKDITDLIERKKKVAAAEMSEEYKYVTTADIGGFRTQDDFGNKIEFMDHQKKAIDLISKKGNGVVGLDTGTGKTLVSLGIALKWSADGTLLKDGKNGKVLYVVPVSLKGNVYSEIAKFCTKPPDEVMKGIDVISYGEFMKNSDNYKKYGAVFFDEAQNLRTGSSKVSKAAHAFNHPRKVLLTASVLEKSPMDLYNLIAIANNTTTNPESRHREALRFSNTFCVSIAGKVIGLKEDPASKRKFRQWVKENTVYVDKTEVKEMPLPPITPPEHQTQTIKMNPQITEEYQKVIEPMKDTMTRMVAKYKNKELNTTELNQELFKVMGQIQKAKSFLNNPDDHIPGMKNPKVEYATKYIKDRLSANDKDRTVTFTDSPRLCEKTGKNLSKEIPGKKHIVALQNGIYVYQDEKLIDQYRSTTKFYYRGKLSPPKDWQVNAIKKLQEDPDVCTFNLTKAYQFGHNIQSANSVVHLDRDSWNNENMKQRTARIWRYGQKNPVDVKILDLVNDDGTSINEIEKYSMEIESELFKELIQGSKDTGLDTSGYDIATVEGLAKSKEALRQIVSPNVLHSAEINNVKM